MKNLIEVIARGVCVKDGKVLLCQTIGHENTYLPGGHVEFSESVAGALCRELHEELGVQTRAGRFLGAVEHWFVRKGRHYCEINLLFEMLIDEIDSSVDPQSEEDHIEFHWAGLDELDAYKVEPAVLIEKLPQWLESEESNWGSTYD